jgi:hypothetical protein
MSRLSIDREISTFKTPQTFSKKETTMIVDGINIAQFAKLSVESLQNKIAARDLKDTLNGKGVYIVYYPGQSVPEFINPGIGGMFRGNDPNVDESVLLGKWVHGAHILYIGKAQGQRGLKQRIRQFIRFGMGQLSPHWGGRYIWQIKNNKNLIIKWTEVTGAREEERKLLKQFYKVYGKLPFANLQF